MVDSDILGTLHHQGRKVGNNTKSMKHELLTLRQMRQADRLAIQTGVSGFALMQAAGRAVAHEMRMRWSPRPTVILCGPGNNGGDGLVVARELLRSGWPVRVTLLNPAECFKGDAQFAWQGWQAECANHSQNSERILRTVELSNACLQQQELVVDALFGAGLNRPLDAMAAAVLRYAQAQGLPVVAIDVPSGVWGDSGLSESAVACVLTVTFFRFKPAHLLVPGRWLCGEIVLADIGIAPQVLSCLQVQTWQNAPALWQEQLPVPDVSGHKYHRGHALIWGGPLMTGAPRLSAMAAARVGAGLTTICVPEVSWPIYASSLLSIMVHPLLGEEAGQWKAGLEQLLEHGRWSAALIGPGALGGTDAQVLKDLVLTMLASDHPVVLDADSLSVFRDEPALLFDAIGAQKRPVVMTPHEGEFSRIFSSAAMAACESKLDRACKAAQLSGAIVLLKGPDTVVAAPDGRAVVNAGAPPNLATAGSGDVLAGLILGLLAQGMPAWQAACAAAWMHGEAAQVFGPGLIAEDLAVCIPAVLRKLSLGARA